MRSLCHRDRGQEREVVVLEARPDGAADQAVRTTGPRRLPPAGPNHVERCGCGRQRPEGVPNDGTAQGRGGVDIERRALVVVPGLVGKHAMPATERARDEEKVDRAERGTRPPGIGGQSLYNRPPSGGCPSG